MISEGVLAMTLSDARKNAIKVADAIFNARLKPEVLDDGEWYIFQWDEPIDEPMICVHKKIGGICYYNPESHPAFKDAVIATFP